MTGTALCYCTWSQVIYITVWSRGGKVQEAGRKAIKRCLVTEHPWGKRWSEELSGIWKTSTSMCLLPGLKELRIRTEWVGFPWWLRWQKICLQRRRPEFDPWAGKFPWRKKLLPTPGFLPWEFHGQRSLAGYGPWGLRESDTIEQISLIHSHRMCKRQGSSLIIVPRGEEKETRTIKQLSRDSWRDV